MIILFISADFTNQYGQVMVPPPFDADAQTPVLGCSAKFDTSQLQRKSCVMNAPPSLAVSNQVLTELFTLLSTG